METEIRRVQACTLVFGEEVATGGRAVADRDRDEIAIQSHAIRCDLPRAIAATKDQPLLTVLSFVDAGRILEVEFGGHGCSDDPDLVAGDFRILIEDELSISNDANLRAGQGV